MTNRPETTVGELTDRGDEAVEAFCFGCGKAWKMPISFLPAATTLQKIQLLTICPTCGSRRIDIETVELRKRFVQ